MKRLFTGTFFRFLIGFLVILTVSFSVLVLTAAQQNDDVMSVDSVHTSR